MENTMKYFKDNNGTVFAYDETQMDLVGDKTPMSDEEVELHLNPIPTEAELKERATQEALQYLASTDWVVTKINEAQVLGESVAELLSKYDEVLQKRKDARISINQ